MDVFASSWDIHSFLYCTYCNSILFSFTDWNMDRLNSPVFSGFRNFINLFGDEVFLRSLGNTALFAIMTTIFKTIVGLGLATFGGTKI